MTGPEELIFLQAVTGADTHATQQRHVGHSIAERLSRLACKGPCKGNGAYICGQ